MTACTNNGGSRARRAVTAALVGVLSVGAAPMVALATEAGAGDVSLLTATSTDVVANGRITAATNEDGVAIEDLDSIEFNVDGNAHYVVPTYFAAQYESDEDAEQIKKNEDLFVVYYEADPSGSKTLSDGTTVSYIADPTTIKDAGTYYAAVKYGASADPKTACFVEFKLVDRTIADATVTDRNGNQLVYSGQAFTYGAASNGFFVKVGDDILSGGVDFQTITVFQDGETVPEGQLVHAGSYVARILDNNGVTYDVKFEIAPLDLETAVLYYNYSDGTSDSGTNPGQNANALSGTAMPESVKWIDASTALTAGADEGETVIGDTTVKLTFKSATNGSLAPATAKGAYTYTVTAYQTADSDKASTDVVGSREVTFTRYDKVASIEYDGDDAKNPGVVTTKHFNKDYIEVKGGKKDLGYELSFAKDVNGKWVGVSEADTQWPGSYRAFIAVEDGTYEFGGMGYVDFTVNPINVQEANCYVLYDGEVIDRSASDIYNGGDFLDRVTVKAYDEDGNEVPASEFDLVVTDEDDDEVDSVVNVGDYTIKVASKENSMYRIVGSDSVTFEVVPVKATWKYSTVAQKTGNADIRLSGTMGFGDDAKTAYIYTGEAVVPTFEYDLTDGKYADSEEWLELPASSYRLEYQMKNEKGVYVDVDECVEPGDYKATLIDIASDSNHLVDAIMDFKISAKKVFTDVPNDAWYSESVYRANELGYIGGVGGTTLFAPLNDISRADVACVIYRMAGGKITSGQEGMTNEELTYISSFEDVDPHSYYAKAVAWTTKMGITNGYGTTFGVERSITTEEFVTMLARYAKVCGADVAVDADEVLGKVADGSSVTGYAREAVAWAVEQGYVAKDGNLIDPQGNVYRARAVEIAVRLQPEKLDDVLVDNPSLLPWK